jgi:hypothetical protein
LYYPVIEVYGYFDGREFEQGEVKHFVLDEVAESSENGEGVKEM